MLCILHGILLIVILLQFSSVQTFLTKTAINYFAKTYDLDLSIKSIYIKFPAKIVFDEVFIADEQGDTLIYADQFYARIASLKILDSKLYVDRLTLSDAFINIYVDTLGVNNLEFLIDKFSSDKEDKEKSEKSFDLFCNEFEFENSKFKYRDYRLEPNGPNFNTADIDINNFNVWISDFVMYGDTIEVDLNDFSLYDRSGLNIKELSAHVVYSPLGLNLNDFVFSTDKSLIKSKNFELKGTDNTWMSDPFNKLSLDISIDTCNISLADIALFNKDMYAINKHFNFSGKIKGKLSDVKLRDLILNYGNQTHFEGDISFNNLPNMDNAFIFADINSFTTHTKEVEELMQYFTNNLNSSLSQKIHNLGLITYTGNITGLLNDIVSYGTITTETGTLKTDLALSVDSDFNNFEFGGNLELQNLMLGEILEDKKTFGQVSLKASITGKASAQGVFDIYLNTNIDHLGLLNYTYNDISVDGKFSNTLFSGKVLINDENLKLNIEGKYDIAKAKPIADLSLFVDADLGKILVDSSLNAKIKTSLIANFEGNPQTSVVGQVIIDSTEIIYNKQFIEMNNFEIIAKETANSQYLVLNSDYLDATIDGNYNFIEIATYFTSLLSKYIPSYFGEIETSNTYLANNFNYTIDLKSLNTLTKVFASNISIQDDFQLKGKLNSKEDIFTLETNLSEIKFDSISIQAIQIDIEALKEELKLSMGIKSVNTEKLNILNNFDLYATAIADSVYVGTSWDDRQEIDYSGNFSLSAIFAKENIEDKLPIIYAKIYDSEVVIEDKDWQIEETAITINNNEIEIENLLINYDEQSLRIAGFLSEDREKLLRLYITNTRLNNLNPLIENLGYKLDGTLTASGRVSGIYGEPLFKLSASIDQLHVNKENFGRFDFTSDWLSDNLGFRIMGSNPFLKFNGNYLPKLDSLNLTVDIDNFKLDILEPFLNTVNVSNTSGLLDGNIFISGKSSNPQLNGYLDFERAQLTYDYLKLLVNLNDTVWVTPNSILFNKFTVRDAENNLGIINGGLYHNKFKDFKFNFDIDAQKLKMLNTTEIDNSLFYGTAYATGNVNIQGDLKDFGIDVIAKTEQGTTFVLPMTDSYEAGENNILSFIVIDDPEEDITKLSSKKSNMSFYLNMDIEVTPDAEAQIVFDPKVGDMIKANCKGNLNIYYDSNDEFKMIGEVEVEKGSYLFTLENIINKRFDVEKGGSIVWSGSPYDAIVDIRAVYKLRAPLWDLMMTVDSSSTYKKLNNIECYINMTGSLMSPDINFDIKVPNADDKVLSQLNNMSVDEKNKQLLYLLIMNRFFTPENMRTDYAQQRSVGGNMAGNTASELLSNQLSNWLSQISKDFDIGVKYRPGDEISSQELEVALSTQLLNERILINGNLGVGQHESRTSNIVGDVEVQVKINKKGNLRVKGFTRANSDMNLEYGPYTNGAGIFYTDDFNNINDLINKFFGWAKPKKKKEKERKDAITRLHYPHQ